MKKKYKNFLIFFIEYFFFEITNMGIIHAKYLEYTYSKEKNRNMGYEDQFVINWYDYALSKKEYIYGTTARSKNCSLLQVIIYKCDHDFLYKPRLHSYFKNNYKKFRKQVNFQNEAGWTALMMCCSRRTKYRFKIFKVLLKMKADTNLKNNIGNTALMYSCHMSCLRYNNHEYIDLLLKI